MALLFGALAIAAPLCVAAAGADAATLVQMGMRDMTQPLRHIDPVGHEAPDKAANRVQALLQDVEQAFSKARAAVGEKRWQQVPADIKDSIESTINAVSTKATPYVLENKATLQRGIDEAVKQLDLRTSTVMEAKVVADDADKATVLCRGDEKVALAGTDDVMTKLRDLQDNKKTACEAAALIESSVSEEQASCDQARQDLDGFFADEENLAATRSTEFNSKKEECDKLRGQSLIAMCGFGDRLQQKCASADTLQHLQTGARENFQQLQAHWESMQQIKCTLQRFQSSAGMSLEAGVPAMCDLTANRTEAEAGLRADFAQEAGELDMRDAAIAALMTEDNFTCQESNIRFSGSKWLTGSMSYNYNLVRCLPKLAILPVGGYPFDFCEPGEVPIPPAEGIYTGSIGLQLEEPSMLVGLDATDARNLIAAAAMKAAVAEMSGLPVELISVTVSNGDGAAKAYGEEDHLTSFLVGESHSWSVFKLDVPAGKPFSDLDEDFAELTSEKAINLIIDALERSNVSVVPDILNITITPPGRVHAPQAGFCVDGYELYDGVLSDNFGECEGTTQVGTCILPIAEATQVCASNPRCAGLVGTTDPVWLARHPAGVAGVGGLPLSTNSAWKSCMKPEPAAVAAANPADLCSAMNGTTSCDSGMLVDNAAEIIGNTTDACCHPAA